jgi:CRISPR-associated protein Cst1
MIRYVGNPYVDAGVAVLELRLGKSSNTFTAGELAAEAQYLKREYSKKIWKSYLMLHLPNSAWTQKEISSDKNQSYLTKVFDSWKDDSPELDRRCAFCNRPAKVLADRRFIPLLTGETVMVCGAEGSPGLPVCGGCVYAVHFYPLASLKVEGKPLFWWAPDHAWTRRLNGYFYRDVQKILAASSEDFIKLRWPATQLLRAARQVLEQIASLPETDRPPLCDVIGIHATNYGADPNFDELRIPRGLLEFWSEAGGLELYRQIEQEAWEGDQPKSRKAGKGKTKPVSEPVNPFPDLARRNRLYEALGKAFMSPDYRDQAKRVCAQFFLLRREKYIAPNTTALAEFFLMKVAGMEKDRLEAIREMADTIADRLILEGGDRRVVWQLFRRRLRLGGFLQCLSQIQRKLSDLGQPFKWERVLQALDLENEDDRTASDHWLVQELILIRLFERLAKSDVLTELPEPEEEPISEVS